VSFQISAPEGQKDSIIVSLRWCCFHELAQYGAKELLQKIYKDKVLDPPENNYDFSLKFNLDELPEDKTSLIKSIGQLKRHAFAAPFETAFNQQMNGNSGEPMVIHYREDEMVYIQAHNDRVTVIFSTFFKEEMDQVFGKVFLQEFVDARRDPSVQNAPQVLYTNREPPLEIRDIPGIQSCDNIGYVTFVMNQRHYKDAETCEKSISMIQTFRDYLHYHIKCSKAYMHSRMRARVADFLKVLNRARPEAKKVEKKTASGRTFVRS